ncbi:MAG: dihydropteroate synthase, partial [Gammaproteobacteria bacterium]|nr:dihydropteroate synthase [Gammaproteobacteria bacterium]
MGVVNVTPDSFFDGGRYFDPARAIAHGVALAGAGADIVDIGGESTRPGAAPVAAAEELRRVLPVVEGLAAKVKAPLSIDTSKPEVMAAAVAAGAVMINDVRALQSPGALAAAAGCGVPVGLSTCRGGPAPCSLAPPSAV